MVRTQRRRKRACHLCVLSPIPTGQNVQWTMNFVANTLLDGRRFRALTVADNFTRDCSTIEADSTLTGSKVVQALARVAKRYGYPKMDTVNNGSGFASTVLNAWPYTHGVNRGFIRSGNPVENARIASFNGRF